jgi:hypothetical protein
VPRRPKEKIDIDVVPYLSIMVIVLKLICLILIVTVMRIALNPGGVKAVAIKDIFGVERKSADGKTHIKAPTYFDCTAQAVIISPGEIKVDLSELMDEGNAVDRTIQKIVGNSSNEYAIVLVRPRAVKTYRYMRRALDVAGVDVGYDVFATDVKVDYKGAARAEGITEPKPK